MGWLWKIEPIYFCSREGHWKRSDVWRLDSILLENYVGQKANDEGAKRMALKAATVYNGPHYGQSKRAVGVYEMKITTTQLFNTTTWAIAVNVDEKGHMTIHPGGLRS